MVEITEMANRWETTGRKAKGAKAQAKPARPPHISNSKFIRSEIYEKKHNYENKTSENVRNGNGSSNSNVSGTIHE